MVFEAEALSRDNSLNFFEFGRFWVKTLCPLFDFFQTFHEWGVKFLVGVLNLTFPNFGQRSLSRICPWLLSPDFWVHALIILFTFWFLGKHWTSTTLLFSTSFFTWKWQEKRSNRWFWWAFSDFSPSDLRLRSISGLVPFSILARTFLFAISNFPPAENLWLLRASSLISVWTGFGFCLI